MTATFVLALQSAEPFPVRNNGVLISALACDRGFVVSDVGGYGPPADVIFHDRHAELAFSDPTEVSRTVFVYVDGAAVALVTVRGAARMVVPLSPRAHHKIVTGYSVSGEAVSAAAVCS